jgi:DNA-binding transcriptional ArsR family regulator
MVKYSDDELDSVFAALADRTRRSVLNALAGGGEQTPNPKGVSVGGLSVSELAAPHGMSLPGFMKHLQVLEDAGLIARNKEGRVVSCELDAQPLKAASAWMSRYEKFWTEKLDSLARYLYQQEELQKWNRSPAPSPSSTSPAGTRSRPRKSGARGPTRKR